eukprot:Clim_evm8s54 gene=Clim_evmTU8s54
MSHGQKTQGGQQEGREIPVHPGWVPIADETQPRIHTEQTRQNPIQLPQFYPGTGPQKFPVSQPPSGQPWSGSQYMSHVHEHAQDPWYRAQATGPPEGTVPQQSQYPGGTTPTSSGVMAIPSYPHSLDPMQMQHLPQQQTPFASQHHVASHMPRPQPPHYMQSHMPPPPHHVQASMPPQPPHMQTHMPPQPQHVEAHRPSPPPMSHHVPPPQQDLQYMTAPLTGAFSQPEPQQHALIKPLIVQPLGSEHAYLLRGEPPRDIPVIDARVYSLTKPDSRRSGSSRGQSTGQYRVGRRRKERHFELEPKTVQKKKQQYQQPHHHHHQQQQQQSQQQQQQQPQQQHQQLPEQQQQPQHQHHQLQQQPQQQHQHMLTQPKQQQRQMEQQPQQHQLQQHQQQSQQHQQHQQHQQQHHQQSQYHQQPQQQATGPPVSSVPGQPSSNGEKPLS